ncbi:hypothetical protein D3C80_1386410 [compost metagenome]
MPHGAGVAVQGLSLDMADRAVLATAHAALAQVAEGAQAQARRAALEQGAGAELTEFRYLPGQRQRQFDPRRTGADDRQRLRIALPFAPGGEKCREGFYS